MSGKDLERPARKDRDADVGATLPQSKKALWPRLLGFAALVVGLNVVAEITGLAEKAPAEIIADLREFVASAGGWGFLLFTVLCMVGEALHIPGMVFIAVAVLSWGLLVGGILGYLTAILAVSFSFALTRTVVGVKVLDEIETPWVKRILSKLDDRPIRTVILLRIPLSLAPQLSQALALTNVTFRDHLIGSAIGVVPIITLFLLLFDRISHWLGWTGV
jgi:uncharacterized membrane protein YdjX (TVP38/TMEM64 family)